MFGRFDGAFLRRYVRAIKYRYDANGNVRVIEITNEDIFLGTRDSTLCSVLIGLLTLRLLLPLRIILSFDARSNYLTFIIRVCTVSNIIIDVRNSRT